MSNPAIDAALDQFVERLTPVSYRTAGVKPVAIDVSLPLEDLRAIGAQLLDAYDAARAAWTEERESALAKIAVLEADLDRSGLEIGHLKAALEKNAMSVASNVQTGTVTASTATPPPPPTSNPPSEEPPAHG